MPSRSITLCTCSQCLLEDPDGCFVPPKKKRAHEKRDYFARLNEARQSRPNMSRTESPGVQSTPPPSSQPQLLHRPVPDFNAVLVVVGTLCQYLVAWTALRGRLGRNTTNTLLRGLGFILNFMLKSIFLALATAGIDLPVPLVHVPKDIRTVYVRIGIEPTLVRTPCCPRCFLLNPTGTRNTRLCTWKRSRLSRTTCGALLLKMRRKRGQLVQVPTTYYTYQPFEPWIRWMLSRTAFENELVATWERQRQRQTIPQEMHDVHDSPFWRSLSTYITTPYDLVFAVFIDWFNPFTNKIAGHVASAGVIVLYCLNLRWQVRLRIDNLFHAGMMPAPNTPDVYTISHILQFVDNMLPFGVNGRIIPTPLHPQGTLVRARVIPLIADLQAVRKAAGYTAPTSTPYCTNCKGLYSEINSLEWRNFRNGSEVRQQSQAWKNAETITKKEELAKRYGVRWTPFYDMPWWDPVRHVTLGWLHCWQEGVLQFHLRILWGFGRTKRAVERMTERTGDEDFGDVDVQESANELADLQREQAEFDASQVSDATPPPTSESERDKPGMAHASRSTEPLYFTVDEDDWDWVENQGGDSKTASDPFPDAFDFSEDDRTEFHTDLRDILLPSFLSRPPTNLGDPGHGKLKGDEFLTSFNHIFPLSVPKLWWQKGNTFWDALLDNFYHLIGSSNIIASFSTSPTKAQQYNVEYLAYLQGVQTLFPLWNLVPNHHFALHYGDLMTFWGPIPGLSDAKGEEVNGILQRFPTSRRLDMPYTMMKSFLRRARLEAKIYDAEFTDSALNDFASLLDPRSPPNSPSVPSRTVPPIEEARFFQIGTVLPGSHYAAVLQYLQSLGQNWSSFYNFPQPHGMPVLAHAGRNCKHLTIRKRSYSTLTTHEADSHIQFTHPTTGTRDTGYIEAIWELGLGGVIQPFILVRRHKALHPSEEALGPYLTYPNFRCRLVSTTHSDELIVLEPPHIITHLTVLKLDVGVFGLKRKSMVVCWALDRGREE